MGTIIIIAVLIIGIILLVLRKKTTDKSDISKSYSASANFPESNISNEEILLYKSKEVKHFEIKGMYYCKYQPNSSLIPI